MVNGRKPRKKHQPEQFDMFGDEGRKLRDEGLERVKLNAGLWFPYALLDVHKMAEATPGRIGSGEDIRFEVTPVLGLPHHHNTWGSLIRESISDGYLRRVGETNMKDPRSHNRETPAYELCLP